MSHLTFSFRKNDRQVGRKEWLSKACEFNTLKTEKVVIVHGFGGHRLLMAPLARSLRQAGLATINWGYRSLLGDIETHANRLRQELERLDQHDDTQLLHVVAHSMGSLVVRQALLAGRVNKLRRIVLLCPPNRGSHVATRFGRTRLVGSWGRICRTFTQLSDCPEGFAALLPDNLGQHYDVAIIAAERDFVVDRHSTHLPGVKQHTVVPGLHSSMLFQHTTSRLVVNFLKQGQF